MTTINEAEERIQKTLALYKTQKKVAKTLLSLFKTFDGEKVTKQMETAAKEALPEYKTYYEHNSSGVIYLYVWGNGIEYKERMFIRLGDIETPTFSYDDFVDSPKFYNSTKRIKSLEQKLKELPQIFKQYEEICEKLNNFNKSIIDDWLLRDIFKI